MFLTTVTGKMLIRYAALEKANVVAVVRREEQVEELKALGAKDVFCTRYSSYSFSSHVLNLTPFPSNEEWQAQFKERCAELKCTLAFDAVAGELTGQILHNMPRVRSRSEYHRRAAHVFFPRAASCTCMGASLRNPV